VTELKTTVCPVVDRRTEACHYATGKGTEGGGPGMGWMVSREVMGGL